MQDAAPDLNRRRLCRGLLAGLALPVMVPLAACGDLAAGATGQSGGGLGIGPGGGAAALLLPLTGTNAALGQNMARAASLAALGRPEAGAPKAYDTGDSAEGAAAAAGAALKAGARLLMGPLRADQTPSVLAVAGKVPVVTFSNDDTLAAQGAFVMGVTPAQSVSAMFSYARAQGLTRIAVVARDGAAGEATVAAAERLAVLGGITLSAALLLDPGQGGLTRALRAAGGGDLPQAVFLPDGGAVLARFAAGLAGSGVQLMGSVQWGAGEVAGNGDLAGAWFAAPPPDLFLPFADRFVAGFGEEPGVVAALGHDAALIAIGLGDARALNRKGLTRVAGFTGVLGGFRFQPDGRCQRDLAVLAVEAGQIVVLAEVAGT